MLACPADILVSGGSAGSGKTFSALLEPLRHVINNRRFRAVFFRRLTPQITNPGGLWEEAGEIYPLTGGQAQQQQHVYRWPGGGKVQFSHMEYEVTKLNWQGSQVGLFLFDELTHFSETMFWYMLSRNRTVSGVRPYVRATCLVGSTIVVQGDASLVPIERSEAPLLSARVADGSQFVEMPSRRIEREAETIRVVTSHGELTGARNHRLFRWSRLGMEEVALEDVAPGDFLASARTFPHGSRRCDDGLAYLVGYTAGDGGITGRKNIRRVMWSEADEGHARHLCFLAKDVCGVPVGIHRRSGRNGFAVYTTASADGFIRLCGDALVAQKNRSFPDWLTAGDANAARNALRGVFDAEGTVGVDRIAIAVTSLPLIQQISVMLRRFGIYARYDTRDPAAPRFRVHRLSIRGEHAREFARVIGFKMEAKAKKAALLVERNGKARRAGCFSDADMVPIDRSEIRQLRGLFGKSWWNRNRCIRRDTADTILAKADAAHVDVGPLRKWASYGWERVARVHDAGNRPVFDVTMPTAHTYFAGCTLSHNCNPDADSWVARLIAWWIDQNTGFAIPERSGVLRWFVRMGDAMVWGDSREEAIEKSGLPPGEAQPKSLTFIASKLSDNPALTEKNPDYRANLMALGRVERARLLDGNWKIRPAAGLYFKRREATKLKAKPTDVTAWIRHWDLAATAPGEGAASDPNWTAGVLLGLRAGGRIVIADVIHERLNSFGVRGLVSRTAKADGLGVIVGLNQDPGQAGKDQASSYASMLAGFRIKIAIERGDKVLRADPFAAQWQAGNVDIVEGQWNEDFLAELEGFPDAKHDDQVDATVDGWKILTTPDEIPPEAGFVRGSLTRR